VERIASARVRARPCRGVPVRVPATAPARVLSACVCTRVCVCMSKDWSNGAVSPQCKGHVTGASLCPAGM